VDLSIVIPVFNEVENVDGLCARLHAVLPSLGKSYEVILVDDGSRDGTWDRLVALSRSTPCLKLIRFRRNFGQTAAMAAGFAQAEGEVVITLDADLQNPPEEIPKLLAAMTPGVDVVSGWRKNRHDTFLTRRLPSQMANAIISKITGVRLRDYGCTLKAYRREVVKNVRLYGEMHRFIPALASWVGGAVEEVVVEHAPRTRGTSKYGLGRTLRVVLDLITVKFLLRYSMGPMQIFGKIGLFFGLPGLLMLLFLIGAHLSHLGFDTSFAADLIKRPFWLMTSFMGIFFGVQFISLGLLAEIQIRTYHESQDKETYVIREIVTSSPA
jgi:glycosyltransferase involved in cell wall biosynthesis